jgi:DNA-binding transcriptional ArsR family regulator
MSTLTYVSHWLHYGMDATLHAIAEPRRREILRIVRDDELSAGEIATHFSISRPAVSQHIRVLFDAGLLRERREGTRRLYSLRPEGLEELVAFLDDFWAVGLERLRRAVEAGLTNPEEGHGGA